MVTPNDEKCPVCLHSMKRHYKTEGGRCRECRVKCGEQRKVIDRRKQEEKPTTGSASLDTFLRDHLSVGFVGDPKPKEKEFDPSSMDPGALLSAEANRIDKEKRSAEKKEREAKERDRMELEIVERLYDLKFETVRAMYEEMKWREGKKKS